MDDDQRTSPVRAHGGPVFGVEVCSDALRNRKDPEQRNRTQYSTRQNPPSGDHVERKEAIMLRWSSKPHKWAQSPAGRQQQVLEADGVLFDLSRRQAQIDGHCVHFPAREAALLSVLMDRTGKIVYRSALAQAAWGTDQTHHRDVDRPLRRLRRRIEPSPLSPARLHRIGDIGYLLNPTPQPERSPPGMHRGRPDSSPPRPEQMPPTLSRFLSRVRAAWGS